MISGVFSEEIMYLEKKNGNVKWFKENELRVKLRNLEEESEIWVTLNQYNIFLNLIMFDFIAQVKRDLMLNVSVKKCLIDKEFLLYIQVMHWN